MPSKKTKKKNRGNLEFRVSDARPQISEFQATFRDSEKPNPRNTGFFPVFLEYFPVFLGKSRYSWIFWYFSQEYWENSEFQQDELSEFPVGPLSKEKKNEKCGSTLPSSFPFCARNNLTVDRTRPVVKRRVIDVPIKAWTAGWESLFVRLEH